MRFELQQKLLNMSNFMTLEGIKVKKEIFQKNKYLCRIIKTNGASFIKIYRRKYN